MTRTGSLRALVVAAALVAAALPRAARASKADAFEGKVQPVSGQLYQKAGRLEVTPTFDLSLNDAFFTKYFGGVKVGYHLSEFLSIHGQLAGGTAVRTGSAVVCPVNSGCGPASAVQLSQVPGKLKMLVGGEIAFSPVYGKLNVFGEKVAHFDFSILGGADWISYSKVLDATEANATGGAAPTATTLGGHLGLGARLFVSQAVAVRLEVKDYLYSVAIPNWVENGKPHHDLQNQIFTELGLSVFFPFTNRAER